MLVSACFLCFLCCSGVSSFRRTHGRWFDVTALSTRGIESGSNHPQHHATLQLLHQVSDELERVYNTSMIFEVSSQNYKFTSHDFDIYYPNSKFTSHDFDIYYPNSKFTSHDFEVYVS